MNRINLVSRLLIAVVAFSIAGSLPGVLEAQARLNYRIGDTPSGLSRLGLVSGLDKYKVDDVFWWVLPDHNLLPATVDPEGEIVFLESDSGGKSDETRATWRD